MNIKRPSMKSNIPKMESSRKSSLSSSSATQIELTIRPKEMKSSTNIGNSWMSSTMEHSASISPSSPSSPGSQSLDLPRPQFELTQAHRESLLWLGYHVESLIMDGSSCSVFRIRRNDVLYALKNIDANHIGLHKIKREISVLERMKHDYIVKLIEIFEIGNNHLIIFEYAPRGDLITLIEKTTTPFPFTVSRTWFKQIVLAMIYLRYLNIAHRDLKADNVLIFEDRVKLADFGHAVEAADPITGQVIMLRDFCGTYEYNAPETLLFNETYNGFLSDIFMLGVLLNVMVTLEFPYEAEPNNTKYREQIIKKQRHIADCIQSDKLILNLLDGLLEPTPDKRFSLLQILCHPWMDVI